MKTIYNKTRATKVVAAALVLTQIITQTSAATYCLTEDECQAKSIEMDMPFYSGDYPTKGCFTKNDQMFFSQGWTEAEMSTTDLPGVQVRVNCGDDTELPLKQNEVDVVAIGGVVVVAGENECEVGPAADPEKTCTSPNRFCFLPKGKCNDKSGIHTGECVNMPDNCILLLDPVCGCDGVTYSNECAATAAGISISRDGECETGDIDEVVEEGDVPCLTKEDCEAQSEDMGMLFMEGEYPTKGCFSKNDIVYFSPGTEEEMSEPNVSGKQERVWCSKSVEVNVDTAAPITSSPTTGSPTTASPTTASPTTASPITSSPTSASPVASPKEETASPTPVTSSAPVLPPACLTRLQCLAKSIELGALFFVGDYATKGCYLKGDKVFFSIGTTEEMNEADLPGTQERLWCEPIPTSSPTVNNLDEASSSAPTIIKATTSLPVSSAPTTTEDKVDTIPEDTDTEFGVVVTAVVSW